MLVSATKFSIRACVYLNHSSFFDCVLLVSIRIRFLSSFFLTQVTTVDQLCSHVVLNFRLRRPGFESLWCGWAALTGDAFWMIWNRSKFVKKMGLHTKKYMMRIILVNTIWFTYKEAIRFSLKGAV